MSDKKFTSGKWRAVEKRDAFIIENDEGTYIADVHFWIDGARSFTEANAHLIAQSPSMFSLLEEIKSVFGKVEGCGCEMDDGVALICEYHKFSDEIETVLKKARGE